MIKRASTCWDDPAVVPGQEQWQTVCLETCAAAGDMTCTIERGPTSGDVLIYAASTMGSFSFLFSLIAFTVLKQYLKRRYGVDILYRTKDKVLEGGEVIVA